MSQPILGFHCMNDSTHTQPEYSARCGLCGGVISAKYHEPQEPRNAWAGVFERSRNAQGFEPIIYHLSKDGKISNPAHPSAPVRPGYERCEAKTMTEALKLEKRINRQELDKAERHLEREEQMINAQRDQTRSVFMRDVRRMSPQGRRIAEIAMKMNDNRRPTLNQPNVHFEVVHFDQANRDVYQDKMTGWKRVKH